MGQLIILLLEGLLLVISFLLLVPILVLFIECIAAVVLRRRTAAAQVPARPRIAVLVPAHDEAIGIGATLERLLPQMLDGDRLIVIADNCTDETAAIARMHGATVIERQDAQNLGKGYALDYGLKFLAVDPPDVVVMVDADCIVTDGAIAKISCLAAAEQKPVQANYLLTQSNSPKPEAAVSILAFTVKNLVRPFGLYQLRLPCLLTGTGMAFPWSVIHQVSLASSNIVEDMQLTLDLLVTGYPSVFCADAEVTGSLPEHKQAAESQRTRWEHGHLQTLFSQVPRLLKVGISQKRFDVLALALDLCVPPLSLLVMLWAATMVAAIADSLFFKTYGSLILLAFQGLLILISITVAWARFARHTLPLGTLLSVPLYVLWKVPLYLAFLVKPQTKWIRTARSVAKSSEL